MEGWRSGGAEALRVKGVEVGSRGFEGCGKGGFGGC